MTAAMTKFWHSQRPQLCRFSQSAAECAVAMKPMTVNSSANPAAQTAVQAICQPSDGAGPSESSQPRHEARMVNRNGGMEVFVMPAV